MVQSNAAVVLERLLTRDSATNWSIQEVEIFNQAEASHGALVADRLGVPFVLLTESTADEFEVQLLEQLKLAQYEVQKVPTLTVNR